jgi:putative ABC transport system permease protein
VTRRRSALGAPLAWLQLAGEPMRLLAATAGIAFAVLLMLMQLGIREALFRSATRLHERLRADLVITSSLYQYQGESGSFAERRMVQALGDAEVAAVSPLLLGVADWRDPAGRTLKRVFLVGFDPATDPLALPEIESGRDVLRRRGWVLFDRRSRPEYGPVAARFESEGPFGGEVGNRRITVGGLFDLGASFAADGNLVMSDVTLREIAPALAEGAISVGLLDLVPGADPIAVRDRLRRRLAGDDVSVMTRDEYIEREKEYWARRTPIGFVLTAGLLVGFAVGSVIVYQILYTDVLDHLHEYATLKAIGYTHRQLISIVLQQSVILSGVGFLPGLGLAAVVYHLIREVARLPADLTVERAVQVLALTIVMCAVAGALAMRKLAAADPAEVF